MTFDQALYIKAVDTTLKADLNVVICFDGFHFHWSKDERIWIGQIRRGAGANFWSNTVQHELTDKAT